MIAADQGNTVRFVVDDLLPVLIGGIQLQHAGGVCFLIAPHQIGAVGGNGAGEGQGHRVFSVGAVGKLRTGEVNGLRGGIVELNKAVADGAFALVAAAVDLADDDAFYIRCCFRGAIDGEGIHHTHVAGAIGGDGERCVRHIHAGDVGDALLVLHSGIGELLILNGVELGAGGGVSRDIEDAVGVGHGLRDTVVVAVGVLVGLGNGRKTVHHIGADVHVVVTHQDHVNVQLLKDGNQLVAAI